MLFRYHFLDERADWQCCYYQLQLSSLKGYFMNKPLLFSQDSLERYEEEIPSRDSIVQLNVIRRMGTYGRVVVRWQAVGDHNDIHDLSPTSGQVTQLFNEFFKHVNWNRFPFILCVTLLCFIWIGSYVCCFPHPSQNVYVPILITDWI